MRTTITYRQERSLTRSACVALFVMCIGATSTIAQTTSESTIPASPLQPSAAAVANSDVEIARALATDLLGGQEHSNPQSSIAERRACEGRPRRSVGRALWQNIATCRAWSR